MRTVFIVPLILTKDDLTKISPNLPDDYEAKSREFWDYVDEKLKTQTNIHKIYFDSLTMERFQNAHEFARKANEQAYNLAMKFKEDGAELQVTEDRVLLEETSSWARMLNDVNATTTTQELFAQSVADREKFVVKQVGESLAEGETAILFLSPGRRTGEFFPSDIRVIRIQPFDPADYLNSWLVTQQLKAKSA